LILLVTNQLLLQLVLLHWLGLCSRLLLLVLLLLQPERLVLLVLVDHVLPLLLQLQVCGSVLNQLPPVSTASSCCCIDSPLVTRACGCQLLLLLLLVVVVVGARSVRCSMLLLLLFHGLVLRLVMLLLVLLLLWLVVCMLVLVPSSRLVLLLVLVLLPSLLQLLIRVPRSFCLCSSSSCGSAASLVAGTHCCCWCGRCCCSLRRRCCRLSRGSRGCVRAAGCACCLWQACCCGCLIVGVADTCAGSSQAGSQRQAVVFGKPPNGMCFCCVQMQVCWHPSFDACKDSKHNRACWLSSLANIGKVAARNTYMHARNA
jgi:hypothetical protein